MTEYERGWSACREAAAKVCQDEIDRITSQPVFVNHHTLMPSVLKAQIERLTPPADAKGTGQRREGGETA